MNPLSKLATVRRMMFHYADAYDAPPRRHFQEMLRLCARNGIGPLEYYLLGLFRPTVPWDEKLKMVSGRWFWEKIQIINPPHLRTVATDKIVLRGGYNFSQNPIPDENAFFNVAAPAIVQHHITVGAGFELVEGLEVSAAYYMALENEVSGPMWHPMMGQVPGSNVTSSMSENSLMIQFSFTGK